jgi:hypothetical protein
MVALSLVNRDYSAALATGVEKWFWGPLCFGENPPKVPFFKPTPLIDGMIAKISLKKYSLFEFLAYLTLRTQKLQCRRV